MDAMATRDDINAQVLAVDYDGGKTNTAEALRLAREVMFTEENGDRPGKFQYL